MKINETKHVVYFRVSTQRQGTSGLGLEAQAEAVRQYLASVGAAEPIATFQEIESGKRADNRPKLNEALAMCKRRGAVLVVGKLDRLSRNVAFIANLQESGVRFVACDQPHANELTVHIFAAVAQHERKAISTRTKEALAAAKARGTKLGHPDPTMIVPFAKAGGLASGEMRRKRAMERAVDLLPILNEIRARGIYRLQAVADELNRAGETTARGGRWTTGQVWQLMRYLEIDNKVAA